MQEEAKKRARAERFGLPASKAGEVISVKSASTAGGDDAKKKARAARFGIVNNGTGAGSSKGVHYFGSFWSPCGCKKELS